MHAEDERADRQNHGDVERGGRATSSGDFELTGLESCRMLPLVVYTADLPVDIGCWHVEPMQRWL